MSRTRLECRIELLIKYHLREVPPPSTFPAGFGAVEDPDARLTKQDGGGTPFAVSNPLPIEELREGSTPRVTASNELCLNEKAGVTDGEGNDAFPLAASAILCTASLLTIVIHLGSRGVTPRSPSHALTALNNVSSFPTCRVGCPATAAVRAPVVSEELCRTRVLPPAAAVHSRLNLALLTCRPTA